MPLFNSISGSGNFGFPAYPVVPGEQIYTTPGTYTLKVPFYRHLVVEVWGGGGAGGSSGTHGSQAPSGSTSTVTMPNGNVISAAGGTGGFNEESHRWFRGHHDSAAGKGGVASGGDVNSNGKNGSAGGDSGKPQCWGGDSGGGAAGGQQLVYGVGFYGGASPNPGRSGTFPGGGGAGCNRGSQGKFSWSCGGGGGGAYAKKTYRLGKVKPYKIITIVVGAGANPNGSGEGGVGAGGKVSISWT